jgi:hypothetical protein
MTRFRPDSMHWLLALASLMLPLGSGCSQFVLLGLIFGGKPMVQPDFNEQTGISLTEDSPIVAVVCDAPLKIQYDHPNIHNDVARYVSTAMASNEILMTDPSVIQSWIDQHPDYDEVSEIGRFFQADYVIEIHIEGFSLYEENSVELLRGRTEAYLTVYEMLDDGSGDRIYETEIDFAFPTRFPRSTGDTPYSQFKMEYLTALSDKITWLFVPRETGAQIHWAT